MLKASEQFQRMDDLSEQGKAFFFLINFLMDEVMVLEKKDLSNHGLLVDFQGFKNDDCECDKKPEVWLNAAPESIEDYGIGYNKVMAHLQRGNTYLVNYTRKTHIETNLTLKEIFYLSEAKYKVLYKDQFVCFSPETFVEIKQGHIYTHPMKGTIDAAIPSAKEQLKNDEKEKAEHYTVVDLLRNDLSLVADEVKVEEFQRIDFIRTKQKSLYAMSSEISGILKPRFRNKVGSIMKTLLPAGSILGAPKAKTLQVINEAEGFDRGFYTGVCGWFDGENLDSAVMIRFIANENGQLYFKSGGGITHMSQLKNEYQEMINKIYVPIY